MSETSSGTDAQHDAAPPPAMNPANRLVLIADGNTGRGRRLMAACEAAGVECRMQPHGAAALETALADRPGLVVAQIDLPLVDAVKLAEILRANPRTQSSRFLFLGDEEVQQRPGMPGDRMLPSGSAPSDVVQVIEDLMSRQDRINLVESKAARGERVAGDLQLVSPDDLISLFQMKRLSGRLELHLEPGDLGGSTESGVIWIGEGDVLQAETGGTSNEKALFRMLAWKQGSFRFQPCTVDEPAFIATSTRLLLQEGLRQIEEWDRLSTQLPPLDSEVRLRVANSDLPNIVHPLTQEVLLLLELYSTVREVVDHCSFPDYQVLRTLNTLSDRSIVEIGRIRLPPRVAAGEGEPARLFNAAQARRIRDWIDNGESRRGALPAAKLLVACSDPDAIPDFANLLEGLPGVTVSPDVAAARVGADDLCTIATIQVEEGVHIELLHIPRSERFAPIWPLAGYRALATVYLLSGPVGAAAEKLAPIGEALRDLVRTRSLHVSLLRKGERVSPDELRENLALIDEASLFLLPLEGRNDPIALLRGLFARIVP